MMLRRYCYALLVLGSIFIVTSGASAQDYIDAPATISTPVLHNVQIGTVNTDPFTVEFVSNASIDEPLSPDGHGELLAYNKSTVDIYNIVVDQTYALDSSTFNVLGGSFLSTFMSDGSGTNISGGTFHRGLVGGNGQVNISGGDFLNSSDFWSVAEYGGTMNIYGGSLLSSDGIFVSPTSTINVYGTDLVMSSAVVSLPPGPTVGLLTGTLEDGTSINQYVSGTFSNVVLHEATTMPEPGAGVLLACVGVMGVAFRRRRNPRLVTAWFFTLIASSSFTSFARADSLFSTLPGDGFSGGYVISGNTERPDGYISQAVRFQASETAELTDVQIAIFRSSGSNDGLILGIYTDGSGGMIPGSLLGNARVPTDALTDSPALYTAGYGGNIQLTAGVSYWLAVATLGGDTEDLWNSSKSLTLLQYAVCTNPTSGFVSRGGNITPAFQVDGSLITSSPPNSATPEPGAVAMSAVMALGFAGIYRRKKRG